MTLLPAGGVLAQAMPGVSDLPAPTLDGQPAPEGGWDGLARLLEAIKPGVDTAIPPTPSQITGRIESLLDAGRHREALTLIEERLEAEKTRHTPGADVQLAFQHARALAATGDTAGAERIYENLTTRYPELPEPWNNLASLYVQKGQLDRAQQALQAALLINPKYGIAHANLADIQLMMAQRSYAAAAGLGVPGARMRGDAARKILEQK